MRIRLGILRKGDKTMVEMVVYGIQPEQNTNRPLVWLKDKEDPSRIYLPICIGSFEASAIYMELSNDPPPRPITYDLLKSILDGLDAKVVKIHINALKEDTFYAEISIESNGSKLEIDSRPSDAIALALRVGASIFVSEQVLAKAGVLVEKQSEIEGSIELISEEKTEVPEFADVEPPPPLVNEKEDAEPDTVEKKIVQLKSRLQEAVAREEYEQAAIIRDEIGRIEKSTDA